MSTKCRTLCIRHTDIKKGSAMSFLFCRTNRAASGPCLFLRSWHHSIHPLLVMRHSHATLVRQDSGAIRKCFGVALILLLGQKQRGMSRRVFTKHERSSIYRSCVLFRDDVMTYTSSSMCCQVSQLYIMSETVCSKSALVNACPG